MTAPRIISAAVAEELYRHADDAELAASLLAAAPDLAASVVALHAETNRLRAILSDLHHRTSPGA